MQIDVVVGKIKNRFRKIARWKQIFVEAFLTVLEDYFSDLTYPRVKKSYSKNWDSWIISVQQITFKEHKIYSILKKFVRFDF